MFPPKKNCVPFLKWSCWWNHDVTSSHDAISNLSWARLTNWLLYGFFPLGKSNKLIVIVVACAGTPARISYLFPLKKRTVSFENGSKLNVQRTRQRSKWQINRAHALMPPASCKICQHLFGLNIYVWMACLEDTKRHFMEVHGQTRVSGPENHFCCLHYLHVFFDEKNSKLNINRSENWMATIKKVLLMLFSLVLLWGVG